MAVDLGGSTSGAAKGGLTLSKISEVIRAHIERAQADQGGALLPVAVAVEPSSYECYGGGNYTYEYSYGGWAVQYNNCVEGYTYYDGYGGVTSTYQYVMNGRTEGTYSYDSYGGQWDAQYTGFQWDYTWSYPIYGTSGYSRYAMSGNFSSSWTNTGMGGNYHYGAEGLTVQYAYSYPDEEMMVSANVESSGSIVYDQYDFNYLWNYSGTSTWSGSLQARDSRRGQWYLYTAAPWVTNWCDQTASGEIVTAGGYYEHGHDNGGGSSAPGNVLHTIGDGSDIVTLEVYSSAGSLISSQTQDWFPYEEGCNY